MQRSKSPWFILFTTLILPVGCTDFLASRETDIRKSTQEIEGARDDQQRARAFSSRGVAYSEKARYGRVTKQIPQTECERLFDLAIKDHNQAVALGPTSSEVYFNRAQSYYDRGTVELLENRQGKSWFAMAASDFEMAVQRNPSYHLGWDRLGLSYEAEGKADKAISAYTQELALNPFGRQRLADAYCNFGFQNQQQKNYAAAAASFEKSTEFGVADDKTCPSEPYANSVALYMTEIHDYDKAWNMAHRAQKAAHPVPPDIIARLIKDSGRNQ